MNLDFNTLKPQIQFAIEQKLKANLITDKDGFILIDGFINFQLQPEMNGAFTLGGPTLPMVGVVGKNSGLVHTFALKALLPNLIF